jgi:hypothetical protein
LNQPTGCVNSPTEEAKQILTRGVHVHYILLALTERNNYREP